MTLDVSLCAASVASTDVTWRFLMNAILEKPAIVATSEATKIKNQLRDLANKAGETAYKRIGLATRLLADKEWIAAEHGGDSHAALETIENDFFGDLCGSMPLARLLKMHEVVKEEDWKKHRFNLQRVSAEYQERLAAQKPERETPVRVTREQLEQEKQQAEHWRAVASTKEKEVKKVASELEQLRRELAEKKTEIAVLQGRVQELERVVEKFSQRQSA